MIFGTKVAALEFAGDEVRLAVVKTGGKLPTVLELHAAQAVYETPEGRFDAMVGAVDEVLGRLQSRPAICVLCMSSAFAIVRGLTIPFRGARRVASAVRFELEPYLAFPIEELLVDFITTQEVSGETDVLAVGVRRMHLDEQLDILDAAGVEAASVSLDALGLTGLWQAHARGMKGLNAVLHVRAGSASLAVTMNKTLAYFRHLSLTPQQLDEQPAAAAREVQNTLRAFLSKWRGEAEIASLHVTGYQFGAAARAMFTEALRLPVDEEVLIEKLPGGAAAVAQEGSESLFNRWEGLVGAAAAAAGKGYALDFQKERRDWSGAARGVVPHLMFSCCLALIVLVGAAFYFHYGAVRNQDLAAQYQAEIDSLYEDIQALSEQGIGEDITLELFQEPPLLDVLAEIGAKMPDGKVTITDLKMAPIGARGGWISIAGTADNAAVFNEVFNELKNSTLFAVAEDPDIRLEGDVTEFRVKAYRPEELIDDSTES